MDSGELRQQFEGMYGGGGRIHTIRAPGRVNLIGEHTDYNDGFVFPMAIEPEVRLICRARGDGIIRLSSIAFPGQIVEWSLNEKIVPGEPTWANYSRGVSAELLAAGIPLVGMDALMVNTLPVGGGLSSSAAIEVATATALLRLAGLEMEPHRLALLCQKAEHDYANVPCGIMDQMVVTSGKAGHAVLYDCRTGQMQHIPVDPRDLRVVIINSHVKHELSGGEYAIRRRQCEAGVAFFQKANPHIRALRDVNLLQLDAAEGKLDPIVFKRCRHVISENARATEAASALERGDYDRMGKLMAQSHASLRDDYEVSCEELDFLSEQAMSVQGVYGARMTGGGFGGCIVALVQPRWVEALREHLESVYPPRFGKAPGIHVTTATDGAREIQP